MVGDVGELDRRGRFVVCIAGPVGRRDGPFVRTPRLIEPTERRQGKAEVVRGHRGLGVRVGVEEGEGLLDVGDTGVDLTGLDASHAPPDEQQTDRRLGAR